MNGYSTTYMLDHAQGVENLAFEMDDKNRLNVFGPILGDSTIVSFSYRSRTNVVIC